MKKPATMGSAYVYSGKDKKLLMRFSGTTGNDRFGVSVAGAGDVNKDGYPELIVGAPYAGTGGKFGAGSAYLFSGKDKSLLKRFDGAKSAEFFGASVAAAGDVNRDGHPDLVVGAPEFAASRTSKGAAYVYSGKDKKVLMQFSGASRTVWLSSGAGAGDVNNDGYADLMVAAYIPTTGNSGTNSVDVYSGKDSSLLLRFNGAGGSIAGAGDIDRDGHADLIVSGVGSTHVFRHEPFMTSTSRVVSAGAGSIVGYQLAFPGAAAKASYIVMMSLTGTKPFQLGILIPLTLDALTVHTFFADLPSPVRQAGFRGVLDSAGRGAAFIGFPPAFLNSVVGWEFYLAAIAIPAKSLPRYSSSTVVLSVVK